MQRAVNLRKDQTQAEAELWKYLRRKQMGVKFRRQHALGNYIVDFCCIEKKLIIELDGSQHLDLEEYDEVRTEVLESLGYRVLRFWNNQVMNNIEGVVLAIEYALEER